MPAESWRRIQPGAKMPFAGKKTMVVTKIIVRNHRRPGLTLKSPERMEVSRGKKGREFSSCGVWCELGFEGCSAGTAETAAPKQASKEHSNVFHEWFKT